MFKKGDRWRNIKTGVLYEVLGLAEDATNIGNGYYIVYRNAENKLFVRRHDEFIEKFLKEVEQKEGE